MDWDEEDADEAPQDRIWQHQPWESYDEYQQRRADAERTAAELAEARHDDGITTEESNDHRQALRDAQRAWQRGLDAQIAQGDALALSILRDEWAAITVAQAISLRLLSPMARERLRHELNLADSDEQTPHATEYRSWLAWKQGVEADFDDAREWVLRRLQGETGADR